MLRTIVISLSSLLAVVVLYLLFWPIDIVPESWQAPRSEGYVGVFAPNHKLRELKQLPIPGLKGPETIILGPDNRLYASMESGEILRFEADGTNPDIWFKVNGRVLGMDFNPQGDLVVADSFHGLFKITPDKKLEELVTTFEGKPLLFTNSVQVAKDGTVYFTDSTTRFPANFSGHTLNTSVVDIFEHGLTGRLLAFHPDTRQTELLTQGYNFANGLALSRDETFLVFAETGAYRILRYWLQGEKQGQTEPLLENLPGFPDNLSRGQNDTFWVALVSPRNPVLDYTADKPFLRGVIWRLPAFMKPQAESYSHLVSFDRDGRVLQSLQEPEPINPKICGVLETEQALFFHSLDSQTLLCKEKEK